MKLTGTAPKPFVPEHLAATHDDFEGNGGRGRVVLLPGSPGRAERVAERLEAVEVRRHPRGHHVFLGKAPPPPKRGAPRASSAQTTVESAFDTGVDIAVVPTGMGAPSTEIIVTELLRLGARELLRIGTAGSIQPWVKVGDFVIASAAVRDESTTRDLLPPEFPALASLAWVRSLEEAARATGYTERTHTGSVHTKASLYAREFEAGPLAAEHRRYKELLVRARVLASEMEAAALFVLAGLPLDGSPPLASHPVNAGALLAVVGDVEQGFAPKAVIEATESGLIELALAAAARHVTR